MRPLVALTLLAVIPLTGCVPLQAEARYELTGTGTVNVNYLAGGQQSGDRTLPFTATATAPLGAPNQFYISAIGSEETGTLTCRLYVNGELVSEQSASGALPVVTCSG
jgi:hypothetical protein